MPRGTYLPSAFRCCGEREQEIPTRCHARTPFLIPPTESSNDSAHVPAQGTSRYFPSRCWTWKLGLHASNRNEDVDEMPQLADLARGAAELVGRQAEAAK